MKTSLLISASFFFSSLALACPQLDGRYSECVSEINKKFNGEYIIGQYSEGETQFYHLEKVNMEVGGDVVEETLRSDGMKVSRKEKIPNYGITVRIDTRSRCEGEQVIGVSDVYSLGMKVGQFTTTLSKKDQNLFINIDGGYLNKEVHKRISCIQN